MTLAQKKAQANFKKAIAYRKKTGCTLKQAFAHVKTGKVSGLDKVLKSGNKTTVLYTKKVKKKAAAKKEVKQGKLFSGIKKKPTEKAILKKVHSAKTSSKTLFNKLDKLDEAQHAHMSGINRAAVEKISKINAEIEQREQVIKSVMLRRSELIARNGKDWYPKFIKTAKSYIAELKKHKTELKKFL
jgi:hypothetical protein